MKREIKKYTSPKHRLLMDWCTFFCFILFSVDSLVKLVTGFRRFCGSLQEKSSIPEEILFFLASPFDEAFFCENLYSFRMRECIALQSLNSFY